MLNSWCTIQLGAREHYAVPRALYHTSQLRFLLTDLWAPATHGLNRLPQAKRLAERFHGDLVSASVVSPSLRSLGLQVASRLPFLKNPWSATILRNQYFQSFWCEATYFFLVLLIIDFNKVACQQADIFSALR